MSETSVFTFSELHDNQYMIVNDSVMGGRSSSQFKLKPNSALYTGSVSLENNGGFASVRMIWPFAAEDTYNKNKIILRVKGDGLQYQFRLRTNKGFDGAAYVHTFDTLHNQEQIFEFNVKDFVPQFRGRILTGMPRLKLSEVQQMGVLIADKQTGQFSIELLELAIK